MQQALGELGFRRTEADHGVFLKTWTDGRRIILAAHMDDCLVTGSTQKLVNEFKGRMNGKYKLMDLGPCKWLLSIKVEHDPDNQTISLSQHAYLDSIIARFNFDDTKPVLTPMDPSVPLMKTQSASTLAEIAKMRNIPLNREAIGSLMYAEVPRAHYVRANKTHTQ